MTRRGEDVGGSGTTIFISCATIHLRLSCVMQLEISDSIQKKKDSGVDERWRENSAERERERAN